jgi:hypothetical protein
VCQAFSQGRCTATALQDRQSLCTGCGLILPKSSSTGVLNDLL